MAAFAEILYGNLAEVDQVEQHQGFFILNEHGCELIPRAYDPS